MPRQQLETLHAFALLVKHQVIYLVNIHRLELFLFVPLQPSEKCGVLNVTKITENGKKLRLDTSVCFPEKYSKVSTPFELSDVLLCYNHTFVWTALGISCDVGKRGRRDHRAN